MKMNVELLFFFCRKEKSDEKEKKDEAGKRLISTKFSMIKVLEIMKRKNRKRKQLKSKNQQLIQTV